MTLKEYLAAEELSESDFAALIGTSQAAVNRYCNGRIPRPEIMDRILARTKKKVTAGDFYAARAAE